MKKPQILFKCILSCLTLLLVSCGGGGDPLPERKSAAQLSSGERAEFVTALLRMKQIPSQFVPTLNAYDYFVDLHVDAFSGHTGAHMAPGFSPWPRELLRRCEIDPSMPLFEKGLQRRFNSNGKTHLPVAAQVG